MKGRLSSEGLDNSKERTTQLAMKVYQVKKQMIDALIEFVTEKYKYMVAEDRVSLIGNLYRVITSSIETKDSKFVNV